ncbi:ParB N-terminal domain-containing protein [Lentilactobacillus senioris]|uniref:ParB N-terminal domain-containing protein n=1 Tax=Lentilactobacillus senioris TaxID=931534 RepID=UPI0022825A91|nr:ParB N-terminal domain-containing protein [Lentilactobacillus senioris]MCY9806555.1 ParB N-terminal domain-containing protein [Lentilactobacillus senioris]
MKIENWSIDDVKPYERNPRSNDDAVESTANSIKQFGWQQPIVVDKAGVIIVGHTRLKAAKQLKLEEVPVVVADTLSEEQVKAYRLADNKTGELANWDFDKLGSELSDIMDIDMTEFGFSDFEYDDEDEDLDDYEEPSDGSTKTQLKWPGTTINLGGMELDALNEIYDLFDQTTRGESFVEWLKNKVF